MATSTVEICNLALAKLGQESITSISDDSAAARKCATFFTPSLDFILRQYSWHCARARVEIAALADIPIGSRWAFKYLLPANPYCLRVRSIVEEDADPQDYPYTVEGRELLTNAPSPLLLFYIKRVTDLGELDSLCKDSLVAYLAAEIAYPLLGSTSLKKEMLEEYLHRLRNARLVDSQESTPDTQVEGSWLGVR